MIKRKKPIDFTRKRESIECVLIEAGGSETDPVALKWRNVLNKKYRFTVPKWNFTETLHTAIVEVPHD